MAKERLRVGVVGTGAIAQIVHLPVLKELTAVSLEAVCDVDRSKGRAVADRLGIPHVFQEPDALLESDTVDAVVICSPNHLHAEQVVAALEAGKHVLVERPLAVDEAGAKAAVEAAESTGRTLMVAFNNRYRPDVRGVKSFISSGELGDVFTVHGTWFNRKVRAKRKTWRHRRATGGGAVLDLGVQVLDLCLWMLDYPEVDRVCAHLHPGERMEVEDAAAALLHLTSGATVSVQVTWSMLAERDRHHVRIFGTAGTASTYPLKVFRETEHGMLDVTPQLASARENAYTASYRDELRHFAAAALGQTQVAPPREQIDLMRIVTGIHRSAERGREISL